MSCHLPDPFWRWVVGVITGILGVSALFVVVTGIVLSMGRCILVVVEPRLVKITAILVKISARLVSWAVISWALVVLGVTVVVWGGPCLSLLRSLL